MSAPEAGWYPDPLERYDYRYWDGDAWTEHASSDGETYNDPLSSSGDARSEATADVEHRATQRMERDSSTTDAWGGDDGSADRQDAAARAWGEGGSAGDRDDAAAAWGVAGDETSAPTDVGDRYGGAAGHADDTGADVTGDATASGSGATSRDEPTVERAGRDNPVTVDGSAADDIPAAHGSEAPTGHVADTGFADRGARVGGEVGGPPGPGTGRSSGALHGRFDDRETGRFDDRDHGAAPGPQRSASQGWPERAGAPPWTSSGRAVDDRDYNAKAIAALVFAIGQFLFPVLAAVAAIILGTIARREIARTQERGAALATAALILGWVGLGLAILFLFLLLAIFAAV